MPEQSEGKNHTSKINVFPVLHTIFFLLWGQKMDLFAPHGAIKSTLWPTSRNFFFFPSCTIYYFIQNIRNIHLQPFFWFKFGLYLSAFCALFAFFLFKYSASGSFFRAKIDPLRLNCKEEQWILSILCHSW